MPAETPLPAGSSAKTKPRMSTTEIRRRERDVAAAAERVSSIVETHLDSIRPVRTISRVTQTEPSSNARGPQTSRAQELVTTAGDETATERDSNPINSVLDPWFILVPKKDKGWATLNEEKSRESEQGPERRVDEQDGEWEKVETVDVEREYVYVTRSSDVDS